MSNPNPKRSWRPDEQGTLLLHSALAEPPASTDAWTSWSGAHSISGLNLGALRLLPLIEHNLDRSGRSPCLDGSAGAAVVDMWCETQVLFHEAATLLATLNDAPIETILLKGAALAVLDYPDPLLRPMTDVDVLVRAGDASRAIDVLQAAGWTPSGAPATERAVVQPFRAAAVMRFQHAASFVNGRGGSVDLHWRVLWQGRAPADEDEGFWNRSVPVRFNDVPTRALAPDDRLLHVCAHGLEWNPMLPIRWIADAAMIVRRQGPHLDWDRLLQSARSRRLTLPLADALDYLRTTFDVAVPDAVLKSLRNEPAARSTRLAHRIRTGREGTYLSHLQGWWTGWKSDGTSPVHRKLASFMSYYAASRGLRAWQAPFHMALTLTRVFTRLVRPPSA